MSIYKQRLSQTIIYKGIRKKNESNNKAQLTLNAENLGVGKSTSTETILEGFLEEENLRLCRKGN